MSITFLVRAPEVSALTLGDLARAVGHDIETTQGLSIDEPIRGLVHVYRAGLTTRAVEVEADAAELNVRILTCSSVEDHELAVAIIGAAAAQRGASEVEPEADDPVSLADFRQRFDANWAAREVASAAAIVLGVVDQNPGKLITLNGPIRPFYVGDRLAAELRAGGPPEQLGDRLIAAIRRTQWPGDCFAASVLEVSAGTSGGATRLAVLTGRTRTLLPDVDAVVLQGEAENIYVRPAVVAELLPDEARFVDERHLLVEPVDERRWADAFIAAKPRAVSLDEL